MTSIYRAIGLLEKIVSGEDKILTCAEDIVDLVDWVLAHTMTAETYPWASNVLDWLYEEARKYEASIDNGSAADDGYAQR